MIAAAEPNGPVEQPVFDDMLATWRAGLAAVKGRAQAVYGIMHGAALATGDHDPEGTLQALVREVHEELGVDIEVGALVDRSSVPLGPGGEVVIDLACYEAVLSGPDPTSSTDHDALRWVPLGALGELSWAPGDVPIIERMLARSAGNG